MTVMQKIAYLHKLMGVSEIMLYNVFNIICYLHSNYANCGIFLHMGIKCGMHAEKIVHF